MNMFFTMICQKSNNIWKANIKNPAGYEMTSHTPLDFCSLLRQRTAFEYSCQEVEVRIVCICQLFLHFFNIVWHTVDGSTELAAVPFCNQIRCLAAPVKRQADTARVCDAFPIDVPDIRQVYMAVQIDVRFIVLHQSV